MIIKFWNTVLDDNLDLLIISNEELLDHLIDMVTDDTYNNGGQLEPSSLLGKFYIRVCDEVLRRMAAYDRKMDE